MPAAMTAAMVTPAARTRDAMIFFMVLPVVRDFVVLLVEAFAAQQGVFGGCDLLLHFRFTGRTHDFLVMLFHKFVNDFLTAGLASVIEKGQLILLKLSHC